MASLPPTVLRLAEMANPRGLRHDDGSAESARLTARLVAHAADKTDIHALADPAFPGFHHATTDSVSNITLSVMQVRDAPINMMRAMCPMPCTPTNFLRYLEVSQQKNWDDNLKFGRIVKELISTTTSDSIPYPSSSSSEHLRQEIQTDSQTATVSRSKLRSPQEGKQNSYFAAESTSAVPMKRSITTSAWRTIANFKHIAFLSPMPSVLRNRDFELIVHEEIFTDGTAVLKAFSTPVGFLVPPSEKSERQVRGGILLSGFVARPTGDGSQCNVTYIVLIHLMGRIPPMLVNLVIRKQTSAMRTLQQYIRKNPLPAEEDNPKLGSKL